MNPKIIIVFGLIASVILVSGCTSYDEARNFCLTHGGTDIDMIHECLFRNDSIMNDTYFGIPFCQIIKIDNRVLWNGPCTYAKEIKP